MPPTAFSLPTIFSVSPFYLDPSPSAIRRDNAFRSLRCSVEIQLPIDQFVLFGLRGRFVGLRISISAPRIVRFVLFQIWISVVVVEKQTTSTPRFQRNISIRYVPFDPSSLDARYRTHADSIEKIRRRFLRLYARVSTKSVSSFPRLRSVLKQLRRQKFCSFSSLMLRLGLSGSFHYSTHLRTGLTMPLIAASIVSANMPIYSTRNCSSCLRNTLETSYLRNTFLFPYRV